jgi:hypothetical protein
MALYYFICHLFYSLGAFVTRYISYEGCRYVKELLKISLFRQNIPYRFIDGERWNVEFWKPLLLSPVTNNNFSISDKFADTSFEVEYENFIMGERICKADPNGVLYFKLVGNMTWRALSKRRWGSEYPQCFICFKQTYWGININTTEKNIQSKHHLKNFMRMADKLEGAVTKDIVQPLMMRHFIA